MYEIWNVVTNRASLLALRNLAVEAAFSLLNGLAGRKTLVHYLEGSSIRLLFCCISLLSILILLSCCFCCILPSGLRLCSILHILCFFLFAHNRTALLFTDSTICFIDSTIFFTDSTIYPLICGCKGTNNISEIAPISLHIFILPPFFLIIHLLAPHRGWSLRSLVIKVIKLFRFRQHIKKRPYIHMQGL